MRDGMTIKCTLNQIFILFVKGVSVIKIPVIQLERLSNRITLKLPFSKRFQCAE